MSNLYLIVGLGNPGKKYENTRHNAGWFVLDELAKRHGLRFDKNEKKALTASGTIKNKKVVLVKPQTFMNLSGESVRPLADFYKVPTEAIIIVHDDMDTPLGTLRLRRNGGAGGQNGVKSIIRHLGTNEIARVRFGVGRPPGRMDPAAYVLQAFQGDDAILAQEIASRASDAIESWLQFGIETAMTSYNGDIQQRTPPPKQDPEEAIALYLRAHELAPKDPQPIEKLAATYKRLRETDKAAEWYQKAAALYTAAGETGKALRQWEQAAGLQPNAVDVQTALAQRYLEAGLSKKAIQCYLKLGERLAQNGDLMQALNVTHEALSLNPQHPQAFEQAQRLKKRLTD
jgi:PTH1 family peptidyl-tRNA hydrolase